MRPLARRGGALMSSRRPTPREPTRRNRAGGVCGPAVLAGIFHPVRRAARAAAWLHPSASSSSATPKALSQGVAAHGRRRRLRAQQRAQAAGAVAVQAARPRRVLQQGRQRAPGRRHPRQGHLCGADGEHGHAAHRAVYVAPSESSISSWARRCKDPRGWPPRSSPSARTTSRTTATARPMR